MDLRQTGANTEHFAVNAKLLRIDIDEREFSHKVKKDEIDFFINVKDLIPALNSKPLINSICFSQWLCVCDEIKAKLSGIDEQEANKTIRTLSAWITPKAVITTDVGQNQVWVAQSFITKGQRILFSSSHGTMGYSLPAAIGAYFASNKTAIAFCGDGGLQMNIQELQFLARENIPVKIILLNNNALGMIRHFQEMYFECNYMHTTRALGYTTPDFGAVAKAYGIPYVKSNGLSEIDSIRPYLEQTGPAFIEIFLPEDTYVFPKLAMGKQNHDQEPELDRNLFDYLLSL
jgi:acetolactate synthase-1/2/3 large subunit